MGWDEELFARIGENYDQIFASEVARTEEQADFVMRTLGVRAGQEMLDLCCGPGRHALALARRGVHVTAVDRNPVLLEEARRRARAMGVRVRWLQADARALPPVGPFSGAICLFASWGYLNDPAHDSQVLAAIGARLLAGARLLMDIPHAAWLERHPAGQTLAVAAGAALRENYAYDRATHTLQATWRVRQRGGAPWAAHITYRVYPLAELQWMLARAGLVLEASFSGYDGAPLSSSHPRCLLLARRPVLPTIGTGR